MTLPPIDIVFFLIVLVFAVIGAVNGFLNEVFGKAAPVVAIWGAVLFYGRLVEPIERHIRVHLVAVILAFLSIFIAVFIVVKLVQILLRNVFRGEIFKSLDRFLGFAFGIVEGVAVVAVVLIVMRAQPWFNTDSLLEGSFFGNVLEPVISIPLSSLDSEGAAEGASGSIPPSGEVPEVPSAASPDAIDLGV